MIQDIKIIYRWLLLSLSTILLSGCLSHYINETPQTQIVPNLTYSVDSADVIFNAPWWESLNRPALNVFVNESFTNNFDVAQAIAVLEQSQALANQTRTGRLPQVSMNSDASKSWRGSNSQRGNAELGAALSWEIDAWSRIDNATKADRLEAQARAADIEAVKLSLSAEVANAYFGAVAAHQEMALLRAQLKLDKDLEDILKLRLESGVGTTVDLLQQQARVADSATLIPVAESNLAVFENRLDVLLGQTPDAQMRVPEHDTLSFDSELPAIGVPAVLLLNRPDLISARRELAAADADIGAAIADRLPRMTLNGSYVFSDQAGYSGPVSLIMGTFIQPLLDWGKRKAEVERNQALYKERLAGFTQRYLEAVEDVENALVQESKQREFLNRLTAHRDILLRAAKAAEERYKQGVDDYQPVINALQELRRVERNLVVGKLNLINFRIDLFRAIGGPIAASPATNQSHKKET
jgi:NodT family efflux transporter outer membrane factor (OMF) lipoprotein